jgi:hypothetical protein
MADVNDFMNEYRECVRHLWNSYFRTHPRGVDLFLNIDNEIFYSLVLFRCGKTGEKKSLVDEPLMFLRVILKQSPRGVPVLCGEKRPDGNVYWEDITVDSGTMDCRFIDFFDWGECGYRDYQYFRTRVIRSSADPALEGCDVLVNVKYAYLQLLETDPSGAKSRGDASPDSRITR